MIILRKFAILSVLVKDLVSTFGTRTFTSTLRITGIELFIFLTQASCDRRPTESKPAILVVSGDTAGWVTPCGCTANQSGGLLRRGTYLKSLANSGDVHYVDAGGAASGTSDYFKLKFETILNGETLMHIAAHNIGASELALGGAYLRDVAQRLHNFPFLSSNTRDASGALASGSFTFTSNGKRVIVVGVLSPRYAISSVRIDDPRESIFAAIRNQKYDSLIVLAYMPEDELEPLAASLPEADAVIGGPTGQAISPRQIGPTLLASATNKGKFLIQLTANPPTSATPWSGQVAQMDASIPDDADQQRNLDAYLSRLVDADFPAAETGVAPPLPPNIPALFHFAGSQSCARCHVADYQAWQMSKHARAGDDLVPRHFQADPACLQCHTTGFAWPGGFISPKRTPALIGSGCENCHGPSRAHVDNPAVKTPFVAMDQCIRCHDEENSPRFDKAGYWQRIKHGVKLKPPS